MKLIIITHFQVCMTLMSLKDHWFKAPSQAAVAIEILGTR